MNQEIIKGGRASNRGITLIALVITIIVLLILAGVTINMVLGDDGIIAQAQGASEAQKIATVKEEIELWQANNETAGYSGEGYESIEDFIDRLEDNNMITDSNGHMLTIGNTKLDIHKPNKEKVENPYKAEVEWEYAFEWTGEEWVQLEKGEEITEKISAKFYKNGEDTLCLIIEGEEEMGDLSDEDDIWAWTVMTDITHKVTEAKVCEGITYIGAATFYDFKNLKSVELPNSLTSIGSYAFGSCSSLQNLYIPSGVTSIGAWAFESCGKLTAIDLPVSLKTMGYSLYEEDLIVVFLFCPNIKDVYYRGTEEQWNAIEMYENEILKTLVGITIHYNYTGK